MRIKGKLYKTVWMDKGDVFMINQNLLPFEFKIFTCNTYLETCMAIKTMIVRGAGAIGASAGYAMAQIAISAPQNNYKFYLDEAKQQIMNTRPTAKNLFAAVDFVYKAALNSPNLAVEAARIFAENDEQACQKIGDYGVNLLKNNCKISTHCNAGCLAFVDYGSALSPIYKAKEKGLNVFVWVDETRPRLQGARLTAWELEQQNISHKIIIDSANAYYMQKNMIDIIIVGADRIAANGDTANKIGTLEKAIAANYYGIPFYVAAPASTFDFECKTGEDIPIEFRTENEVKNFSGKSSDMQQVKSVSNSNPNSHAENPAFDVTPSQLITAFITEKGILRANEINILMQ